MKTTVYIGADHAGFALKASIKNALEGEAIIVEDLGAHELNPTDDYPMYATAVAQAVIQHPGSFGILSCGNAEGVCMAANKFEGIRAGVGFSMQAARTMRQDDDANVLCIPGRIETMDEPLSIVKTFLQTPFSKAPRHQRRLAQLSRLEQNILQIVPALLVQNKQVFEKRVHHAGVRSLSNFYQVDILDNTLYKGYSYHNAKEIGQIHDLPYFELHIMADNPLPIIEAWKFHVPSLKQVIVHVETPGDIEGILGYCRNLGLTTGLAISPQTPPKALKPFIHLLDAILVMGVEPGASGQTFLGKPILKKMKKLASSYPYLTLAVDGGVTMEHVQTMYNAGATQLCASSALWKAQNPEQAIKELSTAHICHSFPT